MSPRPICSHTIKGYAGATVGPCVLDPGHHGVHQDDEGCWWHAIEPPAVAGTPQGPAWPNDEPAPADVGERTDEAPVTDRQVPHTTRPTGDSRAREVGEAHESVAGPPPDLQQAIHAATNALIVASAAGSFPVSNKMLDGQAIARVAVEAAWPFAIGTASQHHWKRTATNTMAKLQAAQDENETLNITWHDECQTLRRQLQAAQAENQQLREALQRTKAALNTALYHYERERWAPDDPEAEEIEGCRIALQMAQETLEHHAALGQDDPEEDDGIYCTACQRTLTPGPPDDGHDPNCGFLADTRAPWIADPTVSDSTTRGQYRVSCLWCGDALTTCHDELADHFLAFHRSNHAARDGDA